MYVNGHGVEKDEAKAIELFLAAAQQGNGDAAFNAGIMYKKGLGVAVNLLEAEHWLQVAHEHGNDDAAFELIGVRARLQELLTQVGAEGGAGAGAGAGASAGGALAATGAPRRTHGALVLPSDATADAGLQLELRSAHSTQSTAVSGSSSKSSSSSSDDDDLDRVRVVPAVTHKSSTPGTVSLPQTTLKRRSRSRPN